MSVLRELKIRLNFEGNVASELKKTNSEVDALKAKFQPLVDNLPPKINQSASAMAELSKATGHSQATLQKMIDATKKDFQLEEQFKKAALAVGLTENEVGRLNSKLKSAEASTANFVNVFKGLAALGITAAAYNFADKAIDESNRAENALIGFKTVVKNTLGVGAVD
ncbi:MAG TPA: hypothetical protein PLL86_24485, partial [Leptospiraceae bacterium]|nr:hypothetical protein [Leptospiraceae bacterium]